MSAEWPIDAHFGMPLDPYFRGLVNIPLFLYNKRMSECKTAKNKAKCNCTYEPCGRKGVCCDCLAYHWRNRELPACLFPDAVERTWDRSLRRFIEIYKDTV
jgi:hypothetical protein